MGCHKSYSATAIQLTNEKKKQIGMIHFFDLSLEKATFIKYIRKYSIVGTLKENSIVETLF